MQIKRVEGMVFRRLNEGEEVYMAPTRGNAVYVRYGNGSGKYFERLVDSKLGNKEAMLDIMIWIGEARNWWTN